MRKKLSLTRGIAGLALSALVFLGCQDLLSEDKPVQAAKPISEDVQVAAQEAAAQEASAQSSANTEPAKDLPANADATPEPAKDLPAKSDQPATTEPASTPAVPENAGECKEIYGQMQTAMQTKQDQLYMDLKNKFGSLKCDITQFSTPFVPPDSATVCKNFLTSISQMDPNDPKYASYKEQMTNYCAGSNTPAVPVETPKTPAAPVVPAVPEITSECKDIYAQMQTAMQTKQDQLYMDLKNKFGSLKCDITQFSTPFVPPDSATVCKNFLTSISQMDPNDPKYASYKEQMTNYCTGSNTPTTPAAPAVPESAPECKDILAQMQTAKEPLYGELKNKFTSLKCNFNQTVVPTVPDSATVCKNLRATFAALDPSNPKYAGYQADIAAYCTDTKTPAVPVATTPTPAAPDNAKECQDIFTQMQTAKDPLYGELKNKFGSLNCDHSKIANAVVPTPPDMATVCKNLRSTFPTLDPSSPKYAGYQQEIATHCAAYP